MRKIKSVLLLAAILVSCIPGWSKDSSEKQRKPEQYGALPLVFEANRGQAPGDAQFVLHDFGAAASFQKGQVLLFTEDGRKPLILQLRGASPSLELSGEDLLTSHSNYLLGKDPSEWHTDVPNYGRVRYRGAYPGIDLLFYGNGKHLEHDFVVSPGADPARIGLRIEGARGMRLGREGNLGIETGSGWVIFQKPVAYQETSAGKTNVKTSFVVRGKNVGFHVGAYDRSLPLVIDPVLSYATYLTGPNGAQVPSIAVDGAGSAYITGLTFDPKFPVAAPTPNTPYQATCKSCPNTPDIFVSKLSPDGSSLVYSTYIGGSDYDQPFSIAVDANGNAIVGGRTQSSDFPTQPTVTPSFVSGDSHGFITSLNANGDGLNWSHYSGGTTGSESVAAVTVDQNNNAYASGTTDSSDFPMTPGTISNPAPGFPIEDVFVVKFDPTGATVFSMILGHNGPSNDAFANSFSVGAMTVDSGNEPIIVGSGTVGIPTTPGSFSPTPNATADTQNRNVFIVKLAVDASKEVFGTYLGGSGGDTGSAVALDSTGNIYVAGTVGSGDFPTTPGVFQSKFTNSLNCCSAFLAKFDPTGANLLYSSFFGGTNTALGSTSIFSIAVDGSGNAYVAGDTTDTSFPLVNPIKSVFPSSFGFSHTAFVSELDSAASHLLFSTIFSGSTGTNSTSMALDRNQKVYITGISGDTDLPTTPGAFQTSVTPPPPNTSLDAPYIAKIDPSVAASSICLSQTSLTFPDTKVGLSTTASVTVTNCGNADLMFTSITIPAGVFQVQNDLCSGTTVSKGTGCTVGISFQPNAVAPNASTLTIVDNASIGTQKVALSGNGVLPQVSVPTSIAFDPALIGTTLSNRTIFVQNTGTISTTISKVQLSGLDFGITSDNCVGVLQALSSCAIGLSFTPTAAGPLSGSVTITDDAGGSPQIVQLTGTGVSSYPAPVLTFESPQTIMAGSGPFTIVVEGSNFFPASTVQINGSSRPTTYLAAGQIQATVSASDIATLGEDTVMVFNPAPGGGQSAPLTLTVYISISVSAQNIVFEPFSRKIYAALSSASSSPNSVVAIDPFMGTMGTPKAVGTQPNQMAVSDDGQFLYIGLDGDHTLGRLNLYTGNLDPAATLGIDGLTESSDLRAFDIQVVPGDPHTAVVSVFRPASPDEGGVDLIHDGVLSSRLDNDTSVVSVDSFGFAGNPAQFFGTDGFNYYGFSIANGSLSVTSHQTITVTGDALGDFVSDGSKFYTDSGRIVDPPTGNILATIPTFFTNFALTTIASTDIGRLFFNDDGGNFAVYDSNSLAGAGELNFPPPTLAGTMVKWGSDGFAVDYFDFTNTNHASDQILLFRTSLAFPGGLSSPVPSVAGLNPPNTNPAAANLVLTVNGSNFVPGAVVHWNGTERTTTFASSAQLLAKIPVSDIQAAGEAQVSVVNPGPVESAAVTFTINGAIANVTPNNLSFGGAPIGGTSASQTVTLTNPGNSALTINSIAASGDFQSTNNCGGSLGAGLSCAIGVTFSPSASGSRSGTLTISDSASGSPQQISLGGTGTDFQLGPGSGGATATIQSGQTATYNLNLTGNTGFAGTVTLGCSGAPSASTCSVNPASISISTSGTVPFTVTVATTARTAVAVKASRGPVWPTSNWRFAVTLYLGLLVALLARVKVRRRLIPVAAAVALMLLTVSCGGGGSSTPPPPPGGTPAGTFNLTVTASNSGATRQMQLTLVVQ